MQTLQFQLAHNVTSENIKQNVLNLRTISGHDESFLKQLHAQNLPNFQIIFELLNRLMLNNNNSKKILEQLTIGDRIFVVLQIYKFLFGHKISGSANCPFCNQLLSFNLSIDDFLKSYSVQDSKKIKIKNSYCKIRPLRYNDQVSILHDSHNIEYSLARNCIVSKNIDFQLSKKIIDTISDNLAKMDPLADITLSLTCISCKKPFDFLFDSEGLFLRELTSNTNLDNEIHLLALHYNWELETILSLPTSDRKKHCKLILNSLSGARI